MGPILWGPVLINSSIVKLGCKVASYSETLQQET